MIIKLPNAKVVTFKYEQTIAFVVCTVYLTLLLVLPSESVGENLVPFIECHCPVNLKAKLSAAGNFSMKQR